MPVTVERTLYLASELTDPKARDRARQWYRELLWSDPSEAEHVIEDFVRVAAVLGFSAVKIVPKKGQTRATPCHAVWWQLNHAQGDGVSFDGAWAFPKEPPVAAMAAYAPTDEVLTKLAADIAELSPAFTAKIATDHRYMLPSVVDAVDGETGDEAPGAFDQALREIVRRLCAWGYDQLRREYEHQASDEGVDEALAANEYYFTATGKREDP